MVLELNQLPECERLFVVALSGAAHRALPITAATNTATYRYNAAAMCKINKELSLEYVLLAALPEIWLLSDLPLAAFCCAAWLGSVDEDGSNCGALEDFGVVVLETAGKLSEAFVVLVARGVVSTVGAADGTAAWLELGTLRLELAKAVGESTADGEVDTVAVGEPDGLCCTSDMVSGPRAQYALYSMTSGCT